MNDFNLWEKVRLPPELLARLDAMIRRVRILQLARGLLATLGVALASILVVMGVDAALVITSDAVRWGLSLAGFALTLLTAYIALWRPLADRLTPVRMARIVETRHPELQERISSALELLGAGGRAAAEGSGQLLEILATDAAADITGVSAKSEFRGTTLRPVALSAALVVAILAVLFIGWPRQSALLFARAVAPGAALDNLAARTFTVSPGDVAIVQGESILFTLAAPGESASRAELWIERPGQPLSVERLARRFGLDDAEALFELEMPAVRDSFRYRMRLGDALTRRYAVTAVPPPAHGGLEIRLDYPAYTGLGATQFTAAAAAPLSAPVGTRAGVRARLNRRMDAALLLGGRRLAPAESLPADEVTFDWLVEAPKGAERWTLALRDGRGFTNVLDWAAYEPRPDYAPHVQLAYPTGNAYTLPTFGLLRLVYELTDDYGLSQTRLAILPDNDRVPWYLDLEPEADEGGGRAWNVAHDLSLSEFQLGGARSLRIWLEVSDTLPPHLGGPNVSKSRVVAVNLDNGQKRSLADQVRIPQREALTNLLESAARRLEEASRKLAAVTNQVDNPAFEKAVEAAEAIAAEAVQESKEAAKTAEKGLFAGVSDDLRDVAETAIAEAADATAEIAAAADADERRRLAEEAIAALDAAAEETRELVPEVVEKDKALEEASVLEAAAVEEARLAQKAMERQLTDTEMDAWQKKQEELAQTVDQYDLRNEILDKEQVYAGEQIPDPEKGAARHEAPVQPKSGDRPKNEDGPKNEDRPKSGDGRTAFDQSPETVKPPSAAAEAARAASAAAKAAEAAKAVEVDEDRLKMARQAESAAKEGRRAATEARRAADALESIERDRAELEAIRESAKETAAAAQALADDALQVRLEAVREQAAEVPPDVAKSLDLVKRAESLAELADKTARDAAEGRPVQPEALAAQAAALRREAEELAAEAGENPFLKQSAERAAEVARQAEDAVAGLRAAAREGADAETAQKAMEQASASAEKAAKAVEKVAAEADRAAKGVQENAVQSVGEADALVQEAKKLHEELREAIAAARAAEKGQDGHAAPANDETNKRINEQPRDRLANLAAEAAHLAEKADEAAKGAAASESNARRRQAGLSAETAQKARQAAEGAKRAAAAAEQAAKNELAGQKPQADQRLAEAKRQAEEAARADEAARRNAGMLAAPAAEHARRAAEAARQAAEQAAHPNSGDGRTVFDQIAAAREAAAAAEKVAADAHEALPAEAARAARQAADKAEASLRAAANQQDPNARKAAEAAAAEARAAAEQAGRLAELAASPPAGQVADLVNEGRLAAKALDDVADKIIEAARAAQEAAGDKKEAAGDAEKTAAAEARAEEARRRMDEARQEAESIGRGLERRVAETRPVIADAERAARVEEAALRRLEDPSALPPALPGQIALQGARDAQKLFEDDRRLARELEGVARSSLNNPASLLQQAERLDERIADLADRAEQIAATPGLRPTNERPNDQTNKRIDDPTNKQINDPTNKRASALAEQLASARRQAAEAGEALRSLAGAEAPAASPAATAGKAAEAEERAEAAAEAAARTAAHANGSITNRENRASAALAASEKASASAAASAAKLAESAGRIAAEEALQSAAGKTALQDSGDGRTVSGQITGESLFKLVSDISAAAGKATAARTALTPGKDSPPEEPPSGAGRTAFDQPDSGDGRTAFDQPDSGDGRTAFDQSKALADEAKALADEAIRAAKLLQAPTPEQIAAAKEAYKAALAMRQMAREHAEKAGLDPATMKAKKTEGGERRARGPKKPAPTEKPGGPGGEKGETEEQEEYEDGLSLEMPEWLRRLGFPRSEWLKYKGSLESGLPDGALDKVAPEYRDLVRRYFEVLSKEK